MYDKQNIWECYQQILSEAKIPHGEDNIESGLTDEEVFALEDGIECHNIQKADGADDFDDPRLVQAHDNSTIGDFIQWLSNVDNQHSQNILRTINNAITGIDYPENMIDIKRAFEKIMPDFILAYRERGLSDKVTDIKLKYLKGYLMAGEIM